MLGMILSKGTKSLGNLKMLKFDGKAQQDIMKKVDNATRNAFIGVLNHVRKQDEFVKGGLPKVLNCVLLACKNISRSNQNKKTE